MDATFPAMVLDALGAALLGYWCVAAWRFARTMIRTPTLRAGLKLAAPPRSVCMVIPAHNEQATIGKLIESLRAQDYPGLAVVLCLDRCTDSSAAIAGAAAAGDGRIHILEIASCPAGWAGKVHAVWAGVQTPVARGADLLLFADADTSFHPSCIRAAAAIMHSRGDQMLSLLSTLTSGRWFERIAQPAATLELVAQYPIVRANRRRDRRAFANGQFMLFERGAYEAIGGHRAVKDELLEDIALARLMADHGRPAGLYLADGLLTCRMYGSWTDFRGGWQRIYTEAAHRRVHRLRRSALRIVATGAILPAGAAANLALAATVLPASVRPWGGGVVISAAGLVAFAGVLGAFYRLNRTPLWALPAFPIGAVLVGRILLRAAADLAARRPMRWGGREYIREPR